MNSLLETTTKQEPRVRVVPRRRGESAPTTIEVPRVPDLPVHQIPSVPVLTEPAVEFVFQPVIEPTFQPVISSLEQSVRQSLSNDQIRRQYENLANAFCAPNATRRRASIVLFSPETSEQVSTVASRLAAVLADRNLGRILLVDGDAARKRLTRGYQLEGKSGLCEILGGPSHRHGEIVASATDRLDLLACGKADHLGRSPKETLRSWLDGRRNEHRHVLCDGGVFTQPLGTLLAQACDATYLVIEVGKTDSAAARRAVASLRKNDANVLGCIVVG